MRCIVYGAGAVGGVLGGRLFQAGHDVVLIARGAHHDAIRDHGLRLVAGDDTVTLPVPVVDHPGALTLGDDDVVLLAMKTQHTAAALADLAAVAPADTPIVCVQNGVENERLALRRFARVYATCVMCPTGHLEPGVVEAYSWPITGLFDIGRYPAGVDETAEAIAAVLETATCQSIPRPDIMRWKYTKLLMNLGNAVQGVCDRDVAGVPELNRAARDEGVACLRAAGIDFASPEEDAARRGDHLRAGPAMAWGSPGGSTWQSLRRGTGDVESDYLNGEIVLLGRQLGIPTPVNEALQQLAGRFAHEGRPPGGVDPATILARAGLPG